MIMNALNSIAYERAELLRDVVYIENDITDNYDDDELFTEAASKFSILPKFKKLVDRYPELTGYEKLVNEVNDIAIKSGNPDKITSMTARKIGTVIIKVWRAFAAVGGVLLLPFCIFIFPIISLLINRLWVWGLETGEIAIAENAILKSIQNATAIRAATNDPAVKKKCDKLIKELNDKYQKLQVPEELRKTNKKAKTVKESADDDDFDVDDIEFTSMVDDDEEDDIDDETINDLLAAMPDTKDEDIERILEIDNDEPIDLDDVVGTNDDDEDIDIDDSELDDLE